MKDVFLLVPVSKNKKLGLMATSISGPSTCPETCALKSLGCYGNFGPINWIWKKTAGGEIGDNWKDFLNKIKSLPKNYSFRHNEVGDLPGDGVKINGRMLKELTSAIKHLAAYIYTHKPVLKGKAPRGVLAQNRRAIKEANKGGFTINISCDSLSEVDEACSLGIGPVVTILPVGSPNTQFTKGGNKVVICPNQRTGITCAQCMFCQKQRSVVVGFLACGAQKNKLSQKLVAKTV